MKRARDSSDAEIAALQTLCRRLGGFDERVSLEWLDGCMAALLCGPRRMALAEWLPALLGDAWERTFADPIDLQQATQTLARRWQVLASQLDAEALLDDPDLLRLSPLMSDFDADERDRLLAAGEIDADEAAAWPLGGEVWAHGVLEGIAVQADTWLAPADEDDEDFGWYDGCMRAIGVLTLQDAAQLAEELQLRYPDRQPSRDELVDDACMALQDLRCYWVEHAPSPPTRRVAAVPGRNDPCPCGSGKKYKKCHG